LEVPRVPEDENRECGKIKLVDGTVIDLMLSFRDLVNGGIMFDAGHVSSIQRDGQELTLEELFAFKEDEEQQVWLPGERIQYIVLAGGKHPSKQAGFFS
jgi:hypothetical protein